jgi:hypothetical protein
MNRFENYYESNVLRAHVCNAICAEFASDRIINLPHFSPVFPHSALLKAREVSRH